MQRFLAACLMLTLLSCSEDLRTRDNGTKLNSKDYSEKEERLAAFNKVMNPFSPIKDVEFDLFNVNGFGNDRSVTVPGASSIFYRYVVKVDTADIIPWIDFLQPLILDTSIAWQDSLISLRKEQWAHTSKPLFFGLMDSFGQNSNNKTIIVVYKPEGIIFREVINN